MSLKYDFNLQQGDTWHTTFVICDGDYTAYNFKMTIINAKSRKIIKELLTNASFNISYDSVNNRTLITPLITASDTAAFNFDTALYDLQISTIGDVTTLFNGEISLILDITAEK